MGEPTGSVKQDYFCILDESQCFDEALMFTGELLASLHLGHMPTDSLWLNIKTFDVARVIQTQGPPAYKSGATEPPQALELLPPGEVAMLRESNLRFRCRIKRWEEGNGNGNGKGHNAEGYWEEDD